MWYSTAQCDLIGQLQQQIKHLRDELEAFRTGKKYLDMVESHKAEMKKLRKYYERILSEKEKEIADAHKETAHVRRIFMEANDDVLKDKADAEARLQREITRLNKTIEDKDQTIHTLLDIKRTLENKNVDAQKDINDRDEIIKKLRARIKKNNTNSSIPTSKTPFRGKVTNGRKPSGRKAGAQVGHEGHRRPDLEPTLIVDIPAPDWILADPDWVPLVGDKAFKSKKIAECCLSVNVTEYRSYGFYNAKKGETFYPSLPGKTDLELEYGDSIKAMAFLLNNVLNVPLKKTNLFFQWASEGALKNGPSTGWISGLSKEFAAKTQKEREEMFDKLMSGDVLYTDQTTARVNGILKNVTVCTDKESVMYFMKDHKGHAGYEGTPTELFDGILVHDGDKTLMHYGSAHQLCNSHEIRYCQAAKEYEPEKTWAEQMQSLLREGIHIRNQAVDHIVPEETVADIENRFDQIIKIADKEFSDNPPTLVRDHYNTYMRIKEGKTHLLYYLHHPEVDPTNNVAERGGRAFKGKMNVSHTFRSGLDGREEAANASAQSFCDSLGALETAKNQGKNLYEYAKEVFGRSIFPAELPEADPDATSAVEEVPA